METDNVSFIGSALEISQLITPYVPVISVILGGMVVGAFGLWNRRRGAVETRAPDVNEIWQQQAYQSAELDMERKWRRRLENWSHELIDIFRGYVRRVQSGGSTDLTPHERMFYDSDPPTSEINITKQK
jgi:hypothetical protein